MNETKNALPGLTEELVRLLEDRYRHTDRPKPHETSLRLLDFEAGQRSVVLFLRSMLKRQEKR